MRYKKIELQYEYDFLEPYIDAETVKTHYEKHHAGYVKKLNDAIEGKGIEERFETLNDLMVGYQNISDQELRISVREFGGGLINHNLYWMTLKPGVEPNEDLEIIKYINEQYGSLEAFKSMFKTETLDLFGSGWTWLVKRPTGGLKIIRTFNQDNPWFLGFQPLFGIDVWEHAYYLKHKGDRASHFEDIWNLINWEVVNDIFTGKIEV